MIQLKKNNRSKGEEHMGKLLKKIKELAAVFAVSAALCAVPVMAGGFCDYGTDEPDDECSLNWAYNEQQHW